jgi:hypothetical protein
LGAPNEYPRQDHQKAAAQPWLLKKPQLHSILTGHKTP